MRGAYFLVIYLPKESEITTKGRRFCLRGGYYVYVGSAMNSLEKRVARHFRRDKKLHWHIDFLLKEGELLRAYMIPSEERLEESLSVEVSKYGEPVKDFGAGDVRVETNLYRFDEEPDVILIGILRGLGLKWKRVKSEREAIEFGEKNEARTGES
jgi:Uri superfamily endonuclease